MTRVAILGTGMSGFGAAHRLRGWERGAVRGIAKVADRVVLRASPPAQACRRLGLSQAYLYARATEAQA